jgi:hypothetical protein
MPERGSDMPCGLVCDALRRYQKPSTVLTGVQIFLPGLNCHARRQSATATVDSSSINAQASANFTASDLPSTPARGSGPTMK